MSGVLNGLSNVAYRLRQSRIVAIGFVVGLAVCIGLIALARAEDWEDTQVYDLRPDSSLIALRDRYVRVSGVLQRDQTYQTQADVGGLKLGGGRYIPMLIEGMDDPVFVYDASIPAVDAQGKTTLVGKLNVGSGAQPSFYIEVGDPPNLPLQNLLARLGIVTGLLLLGMAFVSWLISRADYAISTANSVATLAPSGVGALWFGSLGAEYGNAMVRHMPVEVAKAANEIRLESKVTRPPFAVRIRDIRKVAKANVATAYGPLPAARIEFQDERGLLRKGTLVIGDVRTQNELGGLLQGAKTWK